MTTMNHPSFRVDNFAPGERYMAYDGEGIEVGCLTLAEARQMFAAARLETNDVGTTTITVERA